MDKKSLKTFAINARKKLMNEVEYRLNLLGISEDEIFDPLQKDDDREIFDLGANKPLIIYKQDILRRNDLVSKVREKGYYNVIEEVSYTWFNRIIAIRFMEVNNYLPSKIRVLSSETPNKIEPDIVTEAPNIDLNFSEEEIELILQMKNDNKLEKLFKFLFIKQANELSRILPHLFEKTEDCIELLLSISFSNKDGIIRQLIDNINEEDFKNEVEIIGWMYQYYNAELKDDTFNKLKNGKKITKERIPAATQLFTPNWIVKYMVENSLGRLWLEGHPDETLKSSWKYYLDEAPQEEDVKKQLDKIKKEHSKKKIEEIRIIDPCMGSGHILSYVFDILMQIYLSQGYTKKDAVISILKNNLYGLEIDDRAYQLAYFEVLMKAKTYYPNILKENIELNLVSIQESNHISEELLNYISQGDLELKNTLNYIKEIFLDAKDYGSLLNVKYLFLTI
jgi:hypothetical protein